MLEWIEDTRNSNYHKLPQSLKRVLRGLQFTLLAGNLNMGGKKELFIFLIIKMNDIAMIFITKFMLRIKYNYNF